MTKAEESKTAKSVDHGNVFGYDHRYLYYCPVCRGSVTPPDKGCRNCGQFLNYNGVP